MRKRFTLLVLPLLAGCALYPDVYVDAGPGDSGSTDADAGPDAGAVMGSISAQLLLTGSSSYQSLLWAGPDLAFSQQDLGSGQVTIRGDSIAAGHLEIQLGGLVPGGTAATFLLAQYQLMGGSWNCTQLSLGGTCSALVTIQGYDGGTIVGTFEIVFTTPTIGSASATLSSGGFILSFP